MAVDAALEDADLAVRIAPAPSAELLSQRGFGLSLSGKEDAAIVYFTDALRSAAPGEPAIPEIHSRRASCLLARNRVDEALADYGKAIQLTKDDVLLVELLESRARAWEAKGNTSKAIEVSRSPRRRPRTWTRTCGGRRSITTGRTTSTRSSTTARC